jgi:general secretion pathway protein L
VVERLGPQAGALAVIDVGHERTDVCVVTGGRTDYVRTVARGGRQLTDAIARTWRLPADAAERAKHQDGFIGSRAEPAASEAWQRIDQCLRPELVALARDLRQTVAACRAKTGVTVDRVLLVGGGSRLRGLPSFLAEELHVPVTRPGDAEALAILGPKLTSMGVAADVAWLAAGVAFEGGGGRPTFDLRTGELSFKADLSFLRAKVAQLTAAALILVAFAAASAYASLYRLRKAEEVLATRLAVESTEAFGQAQSAPEVLARIAPTAGGKPDTPLPETTAYDVLLAFNTALPPRADVTVDIDEIDIKAGKVTVRGTSSKTGAVEAQDVLKSVTTALKKHKCFKDLSDESQPGTDGTRSFTLSIKTECL